MWSPTFPRAESAVPTVSSILTMLACGVWWNPPEFLNDFVIKRFFQYERMLHWRGPSPCPQISLLGRRGKVPKCEPQTPRTASSGEGRTGWTGGGPGDGACQTGQKSQQLEMELSCWVTSALQCRCFPVAVFPTVLTTLLGMTNVWVILS